MAAELGLPVPPITVAVRTGDTTAGGPDRHGEDAPDVPGDDPREPLPPGHRRAQPGRPRQRATRSSWTRSTPWPATSGARTWPSPSSASSTSSSGRRPQRIGLSATQRPIEQTARLLERGRRPRPDRHRRLRPRPAPRRPHRAPRDRAVGGVLDRAVRRGDRPHRRPRARAPHHARLREHPADVRAPRPPPRRAARARAGGRPPRQPVQGPPPAGGGPPPGRRPPGPGGHGIARARHRHRAGGARVPGRLAPGHRHLPAAGGALQPLPGGHARGDPLPHDPRRAGGVRGAAGRGAGRAPRRHLSPRRPPRHPGPTDRGRGGGGRGVDRGRALRR